MIHFKEETVIKAPPEKVYYFLTHINKLYKEWHPKDHVFCQVLHGSLDKKGSVMHFFEWIGHFPLYLIAQTIKAEEKRYLEYVPVFPFSLLKLGMGSFTIERISHNETKLIAYAVGGYNIRVLGPVLDFMARKIISFDAVKRHMEGLNIKSYLESQH